MLRNEWLNQVTDLFRYLIMALVLNVPVIYVLLLLDVRHVDFTATTWLYFSCVVMGYYVLPLLLVITLMSLLSFSIRKLAIISIGAIITIFVYYLLIDSFTYNITKIHINLFWLEWIVNDYKGFGLPSSTLYTALLAFLGIIVVEVSVFTVAWRIRKPKYLILTFSLFTVLAFGISQVAHVVAYQKNIIRITSLTPNLPIYIPITSYNNAVKYGGLLAISEDESGNTANECRRSLKYPLRNMKYNVPPDTKPPNIVIVFLESWRFDMMNEKVTPNIFALSRKSSVFLKHFSSGNSTVAGVFGFFYGLDATYWTAVKANNVLIDNPVLIDVLKKNHYAFGVYAKSNFKRHKIKDAIFRGIEVHESFAGNSMVEQDLDMTRQLIDFLREQQNSASPFFAFAFYKSNHAPYWYRETDTLFRPAGDQNLMGANDNTDPTFYLNDYKNSTRYVDDLIGQVLRGLDSLGYMSNTIIIVTTDHGEEFNDNRANYWGHGSNFTQYQTLVPLIFYAPGKEPHTITHATSHVDIVPTILEEFFGCTNDVRDYSNGLNLFADSVPSRPFVVGSYVNHAYIIEDNVYEIYPVYTKEYKLGNIREKASTPPRNMLTELVDEISRFYDNEKTNKGSVPTQ